MMKYLLFTFVFILAGATECPEANGTEGYASSKGVDIHYNTFGEGPPLLIINGGPGMSSEGFIPLAVELSSENKTILFDQRGTGLSKVETVDNSTISMDLMIEDMEALRKHLGIDSWIIMGHSFGGMLAAWYTTHYPERVDGIVFSSSGGLDLGLLDYVDIRSRLSETEQDSLSYWNRQIEQGDTSYHARLQRGRFLAPAYLYNKNNIPVVADRLTQGNSTINSLVWTDLQRINFDTTEQLKSFGKPVLIIQGKQDIIKQKTAETAADVFEDSKMVILDEAGHYGWLDQRERYFKEVQAFLKQFRS